MTFFLSFETAAPAVSYLSRLERLISPILKELEKNTYGDELQHISIISIVLPREIIKNGLHSERKLFQRKSQSADIRLCLDFLQFVKASPLERYEMYVSHIISCIETLRNKVSTEFKFDDLIDDVNLLLRAESLKNQCRKITRF